MPMAPRIPNPLEVLDIGLDSVAEVVKLPSRFGGKVLGAGSQAFTNVGKAIDISAKSSETLPPPNAVVGTGLGAVDAILGGALDVVSGAFDAIRETGQGLRQQVGRIAR